MSSLITKPKEKPVLPAAPDELRALAARLRALGLAPLAAALLESNGAFGLLGAQALYLSQPLLDAFLPEAGLRAWAGHLEDPQSVETLIHHLRQEPA